MKRLFLDLDNVIADFSESACNWFNDKIDDTKEYRPKYNHLLPENMIDYSVWKCYGFRESEGEKLLHEMFDVHLFWQRMDPMYGAVNVIKRLNEKFEIYIATLPQYNGVCVQERVDWLKVHLPFIPESKFIFIHNKDILHGDILVDDRPENLKDFKGIKILFLQPYNKVYERLQPDYVVFNWPQLEGVLDGLV